MVLQACRTSRIFHTARICTSYSPSASGTKSSRSQLIEYRRSQEELMQPKKEIGLKGERAELQDLVERTPLRATPRDSFPIVCRQIQLFDRRLMATAPRTFLWNHRTLIWVHS